MDLGAAGLLQQPFPSHGESPANALYAAQQDALKVLQDTHATSNGLCLLQGPELSGKSTVVRQYVDSLPEEIAVAVVDGQQMNTAGLLEAVLRQFGYVLDHGTVTELLAMLRVFSMQQTVSQEPPLLIVENTHELNPSALRALCDLASLKVRQFSAIKMVLVADQSLLPIVQTQPMEPIRKRVTHNFHMHPMTRDEAREYLHLKILVAGCTTPEAIFPTSVCSELWRASGGWPGILDQVALQTLSAAEELPVTVDQIEAPTLPQGTWTQDVPALNDAANESTVNPPTFFVTLHGKVRQKVALEESGRILIGRSEHNDIPLASKFVSRSHALLTRSGNATIVMDLNSSNGVFVNSKRVTKQFLVHDDIISIGSYLIKFVDQSATQREVLDSDQFADTAIMKTLDDMRNMLSDDDEEQSSELSEDLPTAGHHS
jgi:type II secretory pathway predicted ATPase ExeA/pSer/pThr/pTyr-binding forkhead associated (FHA) protein